MSLADSTAAAEKTSKKKKKKKKTKQIQIQIHKTAQTGWASEMFAEGKPQNHSVPKG